jgi:thioredoxin-dependent peroxiredoxin
VLCLQNSTDGEKKMASQPCKLKEGAKAPAFSLYSQEGGQISLSKLKDKTVVLYFYPKDDTSGCTIEAKGFRDLAADFEDASVLVLGISPDGLESHCKFAKKHGLNFQLLADPDHTVAEKYGVWVEKHMYGKNYMGIQRTTFLIDKTGVIAKIWPKVKPEGHAEDVLSAVKKL